MAAKPRQFVVEDPRREAWQQHIDRILGTPAQHRKSLLKRILGR